MTSLAPMKRVLFFLSILAVLGSTETWPMHMVSATVEQTTRLNFGNDGRVVLHLPARDVAVPPPAIAGDFTKWTPLPMKKHGDEWRFSVQLARGVYRFAFRSADGKWFVPASLPNRTDDQMGGWVAVLVVP
jgi:Glycogen recognition site of AMP-activated protein kinase